jgi:hypothetical protein
VVLARRHARLLLGVPLVAAAAAAGVSVLRGPDYVAQSRLAPEASEDTPLRLGGLASQIGLPGGLGGSTESIHFYAQVLRSSDLLQAVVRQPLPLDGPATTLLDLYGGEGTEAQRLRAAARTLNDRMTMGLDPEANLLTLRTRAPSEALAVATNQALLAQLDVFNQERRQSRAGAERQFLQERLDETRAELARAEGALAGFLQSNRRPEESPLTAIQVERLRRDVMLASTKNLSLTENFERARLDEVRNTPVVTVLENPAGNVRSTGRRMRDGLFGLVIGTILAVGWVALAEYLARERAARPDLFEELQGRRTASPPASRRPERAVGRAARPHEEGDLPCLSPSPPGPRRGGESLGACSASRWRSSRSRER